MHIFTKMSLTFILLVAVLPCPAAAEESGQWSLGKDAYKLKMSAGIGITSRFCDLPGNNQGVSGDLAYLYNVDLVSVQLTPGAGVLLASNGYSESHDGISRKEPRKSGPREYEAEDSWSPHAEVAADCKLNENWHVSLNDRGTFLNMER